MITKPFVYNPAFPIVLIALLIITMLISFYLDYKKHKLKILMSFEEKIESFQP